MNEGQEQRRAGLGCTPNGVPEPLASEVYGLLDVGSPKLAFARAKGFPLTPFTITVGANLSPTVSAAPNQGNANNIVVDFVVEEIDYCITNQNTPAGLDSLTNAMFELQSGIQATVKITGGGPMGGYNPVPDYTMLRNIRRCLSRKWPLHLGNGIKMDFQATVTLPFAVFVEVAYRGHTCPWQLLADMTFTEALDGLQKLGYEVSSYRSLCE